ncbi:MAG: hypothetical protein PWQ37_3101 [Candidatus Petromonas sp.]|nr:hypothetical protein [Thermosediminibacterales bacterium]MDK2907228.1 hypothetical protein [Petrotoga sp.]MDK2920368.1 hypothetical protein [Candidatus Petromonas sp.]
MAKVSFYTIGKGREMRGEKWHSFLRKGSEVHEGKYLPVDNLCGYIYITGDDKTAPVVKGEKLENMLV